MRREIEPLQSSVKVGEVLLSLSSEAVAQISIPLTSSCLCSRQVDSKSHFSFVSFHFSFHLSSFCLLSLVLSLLRRVSESIHGGHIRSRTSWSSSSSMLFAAVGSFQHEYELD